MEDANVEALLRRRRLLEEQHTLFANESAVRQDVADNEIIEFANCLRERVIFEGNSSLTRIYCSLRGDPMRSNKFTCVFLKVPFGTSYEKLAAILVKKFRQQLLFTFSLPATGCIGNDCWDMKRLDLRLLTNANINTFWEIGDLIVPKDAPPRCHLPTFNLQALTTTINRSIPSPFYEKSAEYIASSPRFDRGNRLRTFSYSEQMEKKSTDTMEIHKRLFLEHEIFKKKKQRALENSRMHMLLPMRKLTKKEDLDAYIDHFYTQETKKAHKKATQLRESETTKLQTHQCSALSSEQTEDHIKRVYSQSMKDKANHFQKITNKWQPPLAHKTLSDLNLSNSDFVNKLYTSSLAKKQELRQQLVEKYVKPGIYVSPIKSSNEISSTIDRLNKSGR